MLDVYFSLNWFTWNISMGRLYNKGDFMESLAGSWEMGIPFSVSLSMCYKHT